MDQLNEIKIIDFITESGETIPSINLTYQLFGKQLGEAPVILINHALTGNSNLTGKNGWWKEVVGEDSAINTKKFSIISFNIPGNGFCSNDFYHPDKFHLGDIANLTYGIGESAKDEGEFRYIRITDIDSRGKLIEEGKKFIDIDSESNYILNQGDVLVARTGATFGKCLYFDSEEPSVYAGYLIKVEPDQSKILNKFFWIFSQSNDYMNQKNLLVGGAGQPQFNANALKKLKIPKISIEEQEEIILKYEKENQVIKLNEILINEQYEKINEIISNLYN